MKIKRIDLRLEEDNFAPRCIYHADELAAMVPDERITRPGDTLLWDRYAGWACTQPNCSGFYHKEIGYRLWPKDGFSKHKSTWEATRAGVCSKHGFHRYALRRDHNATTFACTVDDCDLEVSWLRDELKRFPSLSPGIAAFGS